MSKVLGMRELQGEIDRLVRDLDRVEDPAAMAAAKPIYEAWHGLVPIEDGNYRDALAIVWLKSIAKAAIGTAWLPSLERDEQPFLYSRVLEFGNSDTPAQPSMRPALKSAKPAALEAGAVPIRATIRGRRPKKRVA